MYIFYPIFPFSSVYIPPLTVTFHNLVLSYLHPFMTPLIELIPPFSLPPFYLPSYLCPMLFRKNNQKFRIGCRLWLWRIQSWTCTFFVLLGTSIYLVRHLEFPAMMTTLARMGIVPALFWFVVCDITWMCEHEYIDHHFPALLAMKFVTEYEFWGLVESLDRPCRDAAACSTPH